jgi:hypothetical protein
MSFSYAARQTVEAFAAGMGLPAEPARDGSYNFVFARSGTLSLSPTRDGKRVLISLSAQPRSADQAIQRRAFAMAGRDVTTNVFLQCGLARDGSIVFAVALDDGALNEQTLDASISHLKAAHEGL